MAFFFHRQSPMKPPAFSLDMLHPRYWPVWLLMAVWRLVVLLPYPCIVLLGRALGGLMFRLAPRRRQIARRNLEKCFPELDSAQREALLRENFTCTALALLETGIAWWWPEKRLRKICVVEGLEHLQQDDDSGIILLGMHFTNLDLAGAALSLHTPYNAMYRPHKNRVFDWVQLRGRLNRGSSIFPRDDLRTMIRLLRNGEKVWYAPDQDYGPKQSVFASFFGIEAATLTATAKLVKMGKARVVPLVQQRLPGLRGHRIVLRPPLEGFPCGDERMDAQTINDLVEQEVRLQPENYLWAHRRFKTRPPGEGKFYQ